MGEPVAEPMSPEVISQLGAVFADYLLKKITRAEMQERMRRLGMRIPGDAVN